MYNVNLHSHDIELFLVVLLYLNWLGPHLVWCPEIASSFINWKWSHITVFSAMFLIKFDKRSYQVFLTGTVHVIRDVLGVY
jgi:hypothetical protein